MHPTAKPIGSPFIELRQVESTNNYAMGMVHARMAQHGTCVFAHEQTKGKGQREKQWLSGPGNDITMSVIVHPFDLLPTAQFTLSMAVALGVYRFFNRYAGDDTRIKWPNDLYWRDRKAGGILIENQLRGHSWPWAVIGIGVNINNTNFPALSRQPVSLRQITGKVYEPLLLAKELIPYLQAAFTQMISEPEALYRDYTAALYRLGQTVQFKSGSRNFAATVNGVAPDGRLLLQTAVEESFAAGELQWLE